MMSLDLFFIAAALLLFNSLKYIIFGIGSLDHTIFHYTQFVVVNNFLQLGSNQLVNLVSSISLWSIFGLSPHDTTNDSLDFLLSDRFNLTDQVSPSGRRLISTNTTGDFAEVKNAIKWVDQNKFLLTMIILFTIVLFSLIINWVFTQYKRKTLHSFFKTLCWSSSTPYSERFAKVKRRFGESSLARYHTSGFTNFLMKVMVLCYCNLCTITNSQLVKISEASIAIGFMAIATALIFEVGLPIFIFRKLSSSTSEMFGPRFVRQYGSLYLTFKPKDNRFIIIVLVKQLTYSILINLSSSLTITQNSLLLGVNLLFFFIIAKHSPYEESLNYIQALIMSISTVLIAALNYVFIMKPGGEVLFIFTIVNRIVHIGTFGSFIVIQLFRYCRNRKQKKLMVAIDEKTTPLSVTVHGQKREDQYVIETKRYSRMITPREEGEGIELAEKS